MYKINDPNDVLSEGGGLVLVPFSTPRKGGPPTVPDELAYLIPAAKKTFEKINETSDDTRDTYYYMGNGNTYIFQRVKSSTKAGSVSIEMLNKGIDALEEELAGHNLILVLGTGDEAADDYLKLVFKANNSAFFLER